jgi:hypothetical protein
MSEMTHVEVTELEEIDLDQVTGGSESESPITKIVDEIVEAFKPIFAGRR